LRYCSRPAASFFFQRGEVLGLRIPVDVERLDLGAQEMVGQRVPSSARRGASCAVDEAQDRLVVLDGADEALLLADLAAQPGQDLREASGAALGVRRERLNFAPPKVFVALVVLGDVAAAFRSASSVRS
jgi:hypothetical protein